MAGSEILDSKVRRRCITVPALLLAAAVLYPAGLVILPIAAVYDLVRARNFPTTRVLAFGYVYLAWELVAVVVWIGMWLATGFGLFVHRPWSVRIHCQVQVAWLTSLRRNEERLLRLRFAATGEAILDGGPIIMLTRHASIIDTLIPGQLLAPHDMDFRYVMKRELLWDPAIDLIANRIPNYFVDRSGQRTDAELAAIGELATTIGRREAMVIFPEGTRWTPAKRERALEKLTEAGSPYLDAAKALQHTMPPRPAGTCATLDGAPDADVVVLAHTGLEGLAGPKDALRMVPFKHPIRLHTYRVPRDEVPDDDEQRARWLYDQWAIVDDWIDEHRA